MFESCILHYTVQWMYPQSSGSKDVFSLFVLFLPFRVKLGCSSLLQCLLWSPQSGSSWIASGYLSQTPRLLHQWSPWQASSEISLWAIPSSCSFCTAENLAMDEDQPYVRKSMVLKEWIPEFHLKLRIRSELLLPALESHLNIPSLDSRVQGNAQEVLSGSAGMLYGAIQMIIPKMESWMKTNWNDPAIIQGWSWLSPW